MIEPERRIETSRVVIEIEPCYRAAAMSPISGKHLAAYGDTRHAAQAALRMILVEEATARGWAITRHGTGEHA